jgi:hypothetical protein
MIKAKVVGGEVARGDGKGGRNSTAFEILDRFGSRCHCGQLKWPAWTYLTDVFIFPAVFIIKARRLP